MVPATSFRTDDRVDVSLDWSEAATVLGIPEATLRGWSGDQGSGVVGGVFLRDLLREAAVRGRTTALDPFAPYQAHVWMVLRAARSADFGPLRHLSMGWLQRGHHGRVRDLMTLVGGDRCVVFTAFYRNGVRALTAEVERAVRHGRIPGSAHEELETAVQRSLEALEGGGSAATNCDIRRRRSLEAVA